MSNVPKSRPQLKQQALAEIVKGLGFDTAKYPLFIVGYRGYYLDSMGAVGKNDRGIYDDAIFVVSPDVFVSFNGNTDPSKVRKGSGKGAGKGMANLIPGIYYAHKIGSHKGYQALAQIGGEVTVLRDGNPSYEDKGYFGINIHKGGYNTTSSEGCQTIYAPQWNAFITLVVTEAKRLYGSNWNKKIIPYILLDNE